MIEICILAFYRGIAVSDGVHDKADHDRDCYRCRDFLCRLRLSEKSWTRWCKLIHKRSSTDNCLCLMAEEISTVVNHCRLAARRSDVIELIADCSRP